MNENELPADIRRAIAEAVRLVEAERRKVEAALRQPPQMVPKPIEKESGLDDLKEMLLEVASEAGIIADAKAKPTKGKKPTVNQRMAELLQSDPITYIGWSAEKWATKLGCKNVKQTPTWRLIQKMRAVAKAGL